MPPKKATKAAAPPATRTAPFFRLMSLELLQPNAYNARRFKENMTPQRQARFWELVASVREKGILEPLLVRLVPGDDVMFEVIAGERRYRAAKHVAEELGSSAVEYQVPCMIHDLDDDAAFDLMLIENLQREDLSPAETAAAFKAYLDKHHNTPDAVAELSARTGIPPHAIRRQVRLLTLPETILAAWRDGSITQSHAELFTRLDDQALALDLLAACLRSKLTVRELAERIGASATDLDKGFFDQADCQRCPFNTSVQSGLFADLTPAGKCGGPACFEAKQFDFLTANWSKSKAAEKFGTRSFRFGHRLDVAVEPLLHEPADRCRACDAFATIVRLTGAVVSGYERACAGPRACFEELYCQPAPVPDASHDSDMSHASDPSEVSPGSEDETETTEDEKNSRDGKMIEQFEEFEQLGDRLAVARTRVGATHASPASPPPPVEETAPVFDAARGERARKAFVKAALPGAVTSADVIPQHSLRLALAALAISGTAARSHVSAALGHGPSDKIDKLVKKIFEIPINEILDELSKAAVAQVMNDFTLMPAVWEFVADRFGINIARDWRLNKEYLNSLTKSEIVRIGEEVGIWKEENVTAYLYCHHKGKALLALDKNDLVGCFFYSEIDLAGRVPAEVIGKK